MSQEPIFTIAHISDMHFSSGTDRSNPDHAHSIELLVGLQEHLLAQGEIDKLVVSGDISNKGDRQSLIMANGWLYKTIPIGNSEYTGLNMAPEKLCIIPGNHDAWNFGIEHGSLVHRRQKSLEHYNFAFPQHAVREHGCGYDWIEKDGNGIYIAFLDSCFFGDTEKHTDSTFGTYRYDQSIAKGKLTLSQAEQLLEWHDKGIQGTLQNPRIPGSEIHRNIFAKSLKVLVMHHYLFEPEECAKSYFMNIQDRDHVFRNIALSDFDILLCGHKHVAAFNVHPYGKHFDRRAKQRYMFNYIRRIIGLESLPLRLFDENKKWYSKAFTWLTEVLANMVKTGTAHPLGDMQISEHVIQLLNEGLDNPKHLEKNVRDFLQKNGSIGASALELHELEAIQKRINISLTIEQRKQLKPVASKILSITKKLETRPFLQVMSGSSAKAFSSSDKKRSYNLYKISEKDGVWNFECNQYIWAENHFLVDPFKCTHTFSKHELLGPK